MGLDMYMEIYPKRKGYTPQESLDLYENRNNLSPALFERAVEEMKEEGIFTDANQLNYKQAAYWRKVNSVHRWFVENVQNGEDDCGTYVVEPEQLEALRSTCQLVLDGRGTIDPAVHLPVQGGFFFGATDYDEYYYEDVKDTIEQIDSILKAIDWENEFFIYGSSW